MIKWNYANEQVHDINVNDDTIERVVKTLPLTSVVYVVGCLAQLVMTVEANIKVSCSIQTQDNFF